MVVRRKEEKITSNKNSPNALQNKSFKNHFSFLFYNIETHSKFFYHKKHGRLQENRPCFLKIYTNLFYVRIGNIRPICRKLHLKLLLFPYRNPH